MKCLILTASVALLLAACSAPQPVHGLWYLKESGTSGQPDLFIAIVNRGSQIRKVKELVLNGFSDDKEAGWRFALPKVAELPPGGMLVQNVSAFKRPGGDWPETCQVPIEIRVILVGEAPIPINTAALVPSVLPNKWDECPRPTSSAQPSPASGGGPVVK